MQKRRSMPKKTSREEEEILKETPSKGTVEEKGMREEEELNETARKQGLMTDEEFQSLIDGTTWKEENAAEMAEGLDLAYKAVGDESIPEPTKEPEEEPAQAVQEVESETAVETSPEVPEYQQVAEAADEQLEEKEPEVPTDKPEAVTPSVIKPKAVKRKLVLKNDSKVVRRKPTRVSRRCLGRGMSGKAGANTAADAVAISSEEEGESPTKPGEGTLSAANQEDTPEKAEVTPPATTDQKEETPTKSGEGPSDEQVEEAVISTQEPTSQEEKGESPYETKAEQETSHNKHWNSDSRIRGERFIAPERD